MDTALKQRLLGAAVLVALAVTFLPMLVMDPAPESGASDVPLRVPPSPAADIETHELPLVEPATPAGPAVAPATTPPDTAAAAPEAASSAMFPAATAGGDYAVSFGSYATAADAARVAGALRASQLPGYVEAVPAGARTLHRVRIGPYATQADAEAARLRAAHVRDDVGAKVVVLDAGATPPGATQAASAAPAAKPQASATATPVPAAPTRTVGTAPRESSVAATPPSPPSPPAPEPAARPATAAVGFAVQLGAFSQAAEAQRLQDRARAAGFSAFVEPVRTGDGTLHRVRIGPVADRGDADALRTQAAAKLGVSGIVRPHP